MSVKTKPYKDWTLGEAKAFCEERGQAREDGYDPCDMCPLWEVLCVNEYPEKWSLTGFTQAEIKAARAVKVLFPNVIAVGAEGDKLTLWNKDGTVELGAHRPYWNPFPSIKVGEKVPLDEIVGDESDAAESNLCL